MASVSAPPPLCPLLALTRTTSKTTVVALPFFSFFMRLPSFFEHHCSIKTVSQWEVCRKQNDGALYEYQKLLCYYAQNKTCSSYPRSKLTGYSANKSSENPSVPQRRFAPALRHGETPVSPTPFHAFAAPRSKLT